MNAAPRPGRATAVGALLDAAAVVRDGLDIEDGSVSFLRPRSNWRRHLRSGQAGRERLWTVAIIREDGDPALAGEFIGMQVAAA